jgi:acyl carrier protein
MQGHVNNRGYGLLRISQKMRDFEGTPEVRTPLKTVRNMTKEEHIKQTVFRLIHGIAPEADLEHLDPGKGFRDQIEFDSVDFLNLALALQEELKITIPETDFPELATLSGCVAYLQPKIVL